MPKGSKNDVAKLIENILPDNRPLTSLQIVEHYQLCPKNFTAITRTYDEDSDAELWRANAIFSKLTTRYLCLSKTEGLPEYIVETIKVISDKEHPPAGFSILHRTADTDQKAWRKQQIAYKLSKRSAVTQAVTDIIVCKSTSTSPNTFKFAGMLSGFGIYYKLGPIVNRPPPEIPATRPSAAQAIREIETSLHYVNITKPPLPPKSDIHDYEEINRAYKIPSPLRAAPKPPTISTPKDGTLYGIHTEVDGIPFILNTHFSHNSFEMPQLNIVPNIINEVQYNFNLERQILCTIKSEKSSASKNPFFNQI